MHVASNISPNYTCFLLSLFAPFLLWMTAHGGASGRQVRDSEVEGAGLGLFALKDLESGTILGSYPGRKWPQQLWLNRKSGGDKDAQAKARTYVWLLVRSS